jgi:hypothetical protein
LREGKASAASGGALVQALAAGRSPVGLALSGAARAGVASTPIPSAAKL